ncbi:proline racemase family protein [Jatrophihabitans sp. DSM 45814]
MNPKQLQISVTEYHTAGEPFRIVTGGHAPIPGQTILDKRRFVQQRLDHVRQLVINEPRGHADMYGCFLTEPEAPGAPFGTLFFHNEGYSTACGHGTIALATWAIEHGIVDVDEADSEVTIAIDVPSGRVHAVAELDQGRVTQVRFRNVPAFVYAEAVPVATNLGDVSVDIGFGGAFYAMLDVTELPTAVEPGRLPEIIELGRSIKASVMSSLLVQHPEQPELRDIYGVIFYQQEPDSEGRLCQRNVTIFADGEVDRSPCGSGTSTRVAHLNLRGQLKSGEQLVHRSIIDTEFIATPIGAVTVAGRDAVLTEVVGSAHLTGIHHLILQPGDPLGTGFILR